MRFVFDLLLGDSSKCLQHCNQDTLPMAVWEKMEANKHASMQYMQSPCHGQGTIRRAPGDASRGFYGGDTLGPGGVGIGIPREWRGDEHTYDVPFHRQQMPGHHQGTLHHGVTMHHQNQAGQGQYQMAGQLPAQNSNQLNHVCDTGKCVRGKMIYEVINLSLLYYIHHTIFYVYKEGILQYCMNRVWFE